MTTVFKAEETVTITGYERECECSHCGRPLKVGVRLEGFIGAFGSDCLARASAPYKYDNRSYKWQGSTIKERAIIAGKGADCMYRHNMSERHMKFTLATDLRSI